MVLYHSYHALSLVWTTTNPQQMSLCHLCHVLLSDWVNIKGANIRSLRIMNSCVWKHFHTGEMSYSVNISEIWKLKVTFRVFNIENAVAYRGQETKYKKIKFWWKIQWSFEQEWSQGLETQLASKRSDVKCVNSLPLPFMLHHVIAFSGPTKAQRSSAGSNH